MDRLVDCKLNRTRWLPLEAEIRLCEDIDIFAQKLLVTITYSQKRADNVMKPDYPGKMGTLLFPKKINDVDIDLSFVKQGFKDALGALGNYINITHNPPQLLKIQPYDETQFQALF